MNELPDDLQAFEASLSQLSPQCDLPTDRLIYQAGYTAAINDQSRLQEAPHPPIKMLGPIKLLGSAVAGAFAASCLFLFPFHNVVDQPVPASPLVASVASRNPAVIDSVVIRNASQDWITSFGNEIPLEQRTPLNPIYRQPVKL
jgi:hypothetical protein